MGSRLVGLRWADGLGARGGLAEVTGSWLGGSWVTSSRAVGLWSRGSRVLLRMALLSIRVALLKYFVGARVYDPLVFSVVVLSRLYMSRRNAVSSWCALRYSL